VTCLNGSAAAVDGAEIGLSKFSVSELTETGAQSLSVDDAVVRGVSQVHVDAATLALRDLIRHYSVCLPHTRTSVTITIITLITSTVDHKRPTKVK